MFFYIVFAVSMRLSHRCRCELSALTLLVLVLAGELLPVDGLMLSFYTDPILLEFVFGLLLYRVLSTHSLEHFFERLWPRFFGILFLALLPIYLMAVADQVAIFGRALLWGVPVALGFLVFQLCWGQRSVPNWIMALGNASYSLYLFHPYVLRAISQQMGMFAPWSQLKLYTVAISVIILCCILAVLCFQYVERPLNQSLRRLLVTRK